MNHLPILYIVVPCYNEAKTIKKVVEDFKRELPEATIYVYDNNSKDGTDEIARAAGAVVRYETRQGKGNVIRTMFREIDAECYVIEVSSRSLSNDVAYQQAESAYRWLYTDKEDTADADGIVNISENLSVATLMLNTPAWKQTDNNGRKYFTFRVRVFSHRII